MSGDKTKNTATKATGRDAIRSQIFSAKPDSTEITFFGCEVELRQPTLGVILEQRQENITDASMTMLMRYAYVPGTDDLVFEEADEDAIRNLPFGPDMQRLTTAVNKLLGVDVEGLNAAVADATKSTGEGTSQTDSDDAVRGAGED